MQEKMGSVRFELTIDGSLRHASVLQRVITNFIRRPIALHLQHRNAKTAGARCHSGLGHDPICHAEDFPS